MSDFSRPAPTDFSELMDAMNDEYCDKISDIVKDVLGPERELKAEWELMDALPADIFAQVGYYIQQYPCRDILEVENVLFDVVKNHLDQFDIFWGEEQRFAEKFCNHLEEQGIDTSKLALGDVLWELKNRNIVQYDDNMTQLLDLSALRINICLATFEEFSYGGQIYDMNRFAVSNNAPDNIGQYFNNAAIWLICQQGYSPEDLYNESKRNESLLLSSLYNEMQGLGENGAYLKILLSVDWETLCALYANDGQNITIPENATIGLHNHNMGVGTHFEVQLEKPLVIPKDLVFEIQFEQLNDGRYRKNYDIESSYVNDGFLNEAWTSGVIVDSTPTLTIDEMKKMICSDTISNAIQSQEENCEISY